LEREGTRFGEGAEGGLGWRVLLVRMGSIWRREAMWRQTVRARGARWICCGGAFRSWSSGVEVLRSDGEEPKDAAVAAWALSGVSAGEAPIEILPGLAVVVVRLWGCG
jgi:hypothetical protein